MAAQGRCRETGQAVMQPSVAPFSPHSRHRMPRPRRTALPASSTMAAGSLQRGSGASASRVGRAELRTESPTEGPGPAPAMRAVGLNVRLPDDALAASFRPAESHSAHRERRS